MRRTPIATRWSLLPALLAAAAGLPAQGSPFLERYVAEARALRDDGKPGEALAAVDRALERDPRSLEALELSAELAELHGDLDRAVHAMHEWLDIVDAAKRSPVTGRERREHVENLLELDPEARTWSRLQDDYVRQLLVLGKDYERRKDWLAAIEVFSHVLEVDRSDREAREAIARIRREGGREVAVEDVYAGADPTFGKTPEQIEREDRLHSDWDRAWEKDSANYRYRTNAGYLVLETSAIAMEQMNRFYRRFFRYKLDGGKTPKIEIRIFKTRDEYLELGTSPAEWSGGQFTGSAVETYVGGVTGTESIRGMYRTLFHEAAHQFVSLTGPGVPGWLNEAYASFFEGCVILSNGTVQWNQVPPGRLFPLADRMENGWMEDSGDGVRDPDGEWATPERSPTFRMVVEGDYQWGPPWYAPTWGVVYFLYNYRADDGRPVYRDALHEYYQSFVKGRPADPIAHFEEVVLAGAPLSPVRTIDALNDVWRQWILRLRDVHTGRIAQDDELVRFGDAARERGELDLALEFYEEALETRDDDPDLLWRKAQVLEELGDKAVAAGTYRELKRAFELRGHTENERYEVASRKFMDLDPYAHRYQRIKEQLAEEGLALAKGYEDRGLPTMALEIARRMSARFSVPEALDYYAAVARRTGESLARWRLAYDEHSLRGWSGGDGRYAAYGRQIRADVPEDDTLPAGGLRTSELVCDVTFAADFSLEAKMRIDGDGQGGWRGSLMGLCFGRKGDQDYHAVVLHPKGFMDVVTNRGGVWEVHDHRQIAIESDWHTLRIDVTGKTLDVYFDGFYVRSVEFPSRETVRGAFGLITGTGEAAYEDIRVLARDAFDPAAAIEREIAMERIAADASLRQAGAFAGTEPPPLDVEWLQGGTTLEELRGRPVALAFWSLAQEEAIPTFDLYRHVVEQGREHDLAFVLLCDATVDPEALESFLEGRPLPGAHIGWDPSMGTFDEYFVKAGHHGMPRVLLIDRRGLVQFEGDPGLEAGEGWKPGLATYLDGPLAKLLGGS